MYSITNVFPINVLSWFLKKLRSILLDYFTSLIGRGGHAWLLVPSEENFTWKRPPLLLVPSEEKFTWNLYNVVGNTFVHQVRLPNKRFCGSSKGWLICVERDRSVRLINTFNRIKGSEKKEYIVQLPPLNHVAGLNNVHYYVFKAMITSDPVLDTKNCTVAVIYGGMQSLAFLRLGKDKKWTYVKPRKDKNDILWAMFEEIVLVDGDKFYAIQHSNDSLYSFDTNTRSRKVSTPKLVEQNTLTLPDYFLFKKYLVYSVEKELLMVHRYEKGMPVTDKHKTAKFKIFKLSLDKCEWIEKETLGDVALFVGDHSSMSVLASNIPGCMPNCIYFTQDYDGDEQGSELIIDYGVFDIQSQTISKPFCKEAKSLMEKTTRPSIWV